MSPQIIALLLDALQETAIMVAVSGALAALFGVPLGVILVVTGRGHVVQNLFVNRVLGAIVNAARSTPFIILMVAIIPLTRMIVGTSIGTAAAIVPLSLAAIPFAARLVETALREVDSGLIEAAQSMGASPLQIIRKVLLPEAWPGIIAGLTITLVSLIGYSAMAGAVGGGGLGDLGIRYGYQRFQPEVMLAVVVVLIVLVQAVQTAGDMLARRLNKRSSSKDRA
jgi:D-methionine transport system permease protein